MYREKYMKQKMETGRKGKEVRGGKELNDRDPEIQYVYSVIKVARDTEI